MNKEKRNTKICLVCHKIYQKRYREGLRDWNARKFCSLKCANIGKKRRKKTVFYFCIDCEKEISYKSKRCYSCNKKEYWKNHPEKQIKIPICIDCDTQLSDNRHKRCATCQGQIRTKPQNYCKDCGKQINYNAKRCNKCCGINMRGANHPLYGVHKYGKNAYSWIDGRTPLHHLIRNIEEYKKWHTICLKRDNYTCQECGQYGGNLEVHHEIAFAAILNDFLIEYDQFSPMEDKETLARLASKYKPFWNIDNGKTLCKDCHRLTFTGRPKIERRFT